MVCRDLCEKPKQTILLINEIYKIKPLSDLNVLLKSTRLRKINKVIYNKEYNVKFGNAFTIFATSIKIDKLTEAIHSSYFLL